MQEERKLHANAAERFCTLGVQLKRQPQAAAAHLRGIWNAGQEVRRDPAYEKEYEKLLVEQIDTWSTSESAQQARLWQGRLYESRGHWEKAAAAYTSIAAESQTQVTTSGKKTNHAPAHDRCSCCPWRIAMRNAGRALVYAAASTNVDTAASGRS